MKTVIEIVKKAGFVTPWTEAEGEALERFASAIRARSNT